MARYNDATTQSRIDAARAALAKVPGPLERARAFARSILRRRDHKAALERSRERVEAWSGERRLDEVEGER